MRWIWIGAMALFALGALACGGRKARSAYAIDYAFPTAIDIPTTRRTLANGLEVILHEDHAVPLVAVNLWYRVGSKDEPVGRGGMAHLVEHLMFTGTAHTEEGDHFKLLKRAGGRDINAWTWFDTTDYQETVPPSALELALWMETERMAFFGAKLGQATLDRERSVVLNELRQRYDNERAGMSWQIVNAALFPAGHPYHGSTIGTESELRTVTLDDVMKFQASYYVPANATLSLVGDFDSAAALAAIERTLGAVAAKPRPAVKETPVPVQLAGEKTLYIEADINRPLLVVAWPAMPRYGAGWTELEMATRPFEGNLSYGLEKEEKLAEDVDVTLDGRVMSGVLAASVRLRPDASAEKALAQFDRWLDFARARQYHWDRTRYAIGRARVIMGSVYNLEDFSSRAAELNEYNFYAGTPDFATTELLARKKVRVEDLSEALYEWAPQDRRVVAFIQPNEKAPRSGRLVRQTP